MHGEFDGVRVEPEGEGQARLWVKIYEQYPLAELGQCRAKARHGGRLGDAALLVGDGEHTGHADQCVNRSRLVTTPGALNLGVSYPSADDEDDVRPPC
jgi:hypothetical protein